MDHLNDAIDDLADDILEDLAGIVMPSGEELDHAAAAFLEITRNPRLPDTPPGPAPAEPQEEPGGLLPSSGGAVRFPAGEGRAAVKLLQSAEDLRRMHDVIALCRGAAQNLYEVEGWRPERPVARVLAAAGFVPAPALGLRPSPADPDTQYVEIMRFELPEGASLAGVEGRVRDALSGKTGGFSAVVAGQTGFHRLPAVFSLAWHAAGCPKILVSHPAWVEGLTGPGRPGAIRDVLGANLSHAGSSLYWGNISFED